MESLTLAFCDWLLLLSFMFSGFIHIVVCVSASFLSRRQKKKIDHIMTTFLQRALFIYYLVCIFPYHSVCLLHLSTLTA